MSYWMLYAYVKYSIDISYSEKRDTKRRRCYWIFYNHGKYGSKKAIQWPHYATRGETKWNKMTINPASIVKSNLLKGIECESIKLHEKKEQKRKRFREQKDWLTQNFYLQKMSTYMSKLEQLVEARSWKAARKLMEDQSAK